MWCGPNAIARVTGWTRDDVWLHVRWLKEQRGEPFGDTPRGGVKWDDLFSALARAGYCAKPAWAGRRRMAYEDFAGTIGKRGIWIVEQHHHAAVHDAREPWARRGGRFRYNRIIRAWRIEKASGPWSPPTDPMWYRAALGDASATQKDNQEGTK